MRTEAVSQASDKALALQMAFRLEGDSVLARSDPGRFRSQAHPRASACSVSRAEARRRCRPRSGTSRSWPLSWIRYAHTGNAVNAAHRAAGVADALRALLKVAPVAGYARLLQLERGLTALGWSARAASAAPSARAGAGARAGGRASRSPCVRFSPVAKSDCAPRSVAAGPPPASALTTHGTPGTRGSGARHRADSSLAHEVSRRRGSAQASQLIREHACRRSPAKPRAAAGRFPNPHLPTASAGSRAGPRTA